MSRLREVSGTYGAYRTPCVVLVYDQRGGGSWYAVADSLNVNFTHAEIGDGVDVEALPDTDTMTASRPVESLEDLHGEIEGC